MSGDSRRIQRSLVLTVLLVMHTALSVSGAENDKVTIAIDGCPDVSEAEVERILGIELRTIVGEKKEVIAAPTSVTAVCESDNVEMHARVESKDRSFYQTVPLTTKDAEGDQRLIAIAAAELVFSAWVAVSPAPEGPSKSSATEVEKPKPTEKPKPAPSDGATEEPPLQTNAVPNKVQMKIELGPSWRMYRKGPSHFWGGELDLGMLPIGPLHLRAGVIVEGGRVRTTVGRATYLAISGAFGVGVFKQILDAVDIGTMAGGRFGWASLKGKSTRENVSTGSVKGGFGGPVLAIFVNSSTNPYAALTAELGYSFYGNIGHLDAGRVVATSDIWVSTILAIGVRF